MNMLAVNPILKKGKLRKDGTHLIYIQYCYDSDKRILLGTDIIIPIKFWDKRSLTISESLPLCYGDSIELNEQIRNLVRKTEDLVDFGVKLKTENVLMFLKQNFDLKNDFQSIKLKILNNIKETEINDPRKNLDLYFQIDDYISSKHEKVTPGMLRIYRNMKEHLQAFEVYRKKKITFNSFDLDPYESFVDFLSFTYIQRRRKEVIHGLKTNTIGKTIKQLRIFIRNRMRKKIIPQIDLSDFKIIEESVDAIYLTWSGISKIYYLDLSKSPI